MSSLEPFAPGSEILQFRVLERVSSSVWKAEDTRSGKTVALKLLTRQLPKDAARREQVVRDVRLGAALYHAFLVPIIDVIATGDSLLMSMDFVEGQPLTRFLGGKPLAKGDVTRIAYQIADVVKFLQARNMVHGNLTGDSVIVLPNGQIRLGGLNLLNLMPRKEGTSSAAFQQKGSDPRSVAYMAPEQIAGQPVEGRTDVFSFGVLVYEMATGSLPWVGTTAGDLARAIVEGQPQSPRAKNPQIDNNVMGLIGHCVFKDPYRRHKDFRAVIEEIAKVDPAAATFASEAAAAKPAAAAGAAAGANVRPAILLLADVVGYDAAFATDPDAAMKAAARMQQILGEAVYLFDGTIVDPFGPRVVAELASVESAIEAARKAEFDVQPEQQGADPIQVRLLLTAGDVTTKDGLVIGDAVTRGFAALDHVPPLQLFISEEFVKKGRPSIRLRDAGARGGLKLFEIAPAEPVKKVEPKPVETVAAVAAEDTGAPPMQPRRSRAVLFSAIGLLLLLAGVSGIFLTRRGSREAAPAAAPAAKPVAQLPRTFVLDAFSAEGADPALLERASAIRLTTIEILKNIPDLQIVETSSPAAATLAAKIRVGATGPEIVPTLSGAHTAAGAALPVPDVASGVHAIVQWVGSVAHVRTAPVAPEALNAFAEALLARSNKDDAKYEAALRSATKADPTFLPAQLQAMSHFESRGNAAEALAAARQVLAIAPDRVDAARKVARGSLAEGDLASSFGAYGVILKKEPKDTEALNIFGRYAFAVGDAQKFGAVVAKLKQVPPDERAVHEPDLLLASGKIEGAIDQYYNIEADIPNNPALSLKIGRIAVLRHTVEIADLELAKLEKSDPQYGYPLLKAYIAAQRNSKADAEEALKTALAGSKPGDDYWTCAAEVKAILGDTKGVIDAVQKAADRREPTMSYVLADPLFSYLATDAKFQAVRASIVARGDEVRAALAQAPI